MATAAAACCAPLGSASLSDKEAEATARVFKALADDDLGRSGGVAGPDLLAQGILVGLLGGHRLPPWRSTAAARPPRASRRSE